MKLFAIICTLLVGSYIQATVGNIFENAVKLKLEEGRKYIVAHDPLPVHSIRPLIFKDSAIKTDIALNMSQVTVSKGGNFVVNNINNSVLTLLPEISFNSEFGIRFPTLHVQGDFEVIGLILGLEVTGRGKFTVDITNLVVNGEIQTKILNSGTLRVVNNSMSYTVQDAKVTQTGLKVEGMTDQQVHDFLNNTMIKLLQINELGISEKIARQTMNDANIFLEGKTLKDIVSAWKKLFDAGGH